jgi:hypothetical protein
MLMFGTRMSMVQPMVLSIRTKNTEWLLKVMLMKFHGTSIIFQKKDLFMLSGMEVLIKRSQPAEE